MFDVVIVGGNLVGAAAALALAQSGRTVALIDGNHPPQVVGQWDSRIYAISPANRQWLDRLGVWQLMAAERLAPVTAMQIYGDAGTSMQFDAYRAHLPALAFVVESQRLQAAIWERLGAWPAVEKIAPERAKDLHITDKYVELDLESGRRLQARLLIGADGARSWVRQVMGIGQQLHDYHQRGVVANFSTAVAPQGVAWQWFRSDGVLAYLPLPGNRMSMVWSTQEQRADYLLQLSAEALCAEVATAGQQVLGSLSLITPAAAFPLRLTHADAVVQPRLALVGDAAHTVHPLAGQGVNLGFGDVICLQQALAGAPDPGDAVRLRRYARARALPVQAMASTTHGLSRLFDVDDPLIRMLRNVGMGCVERQPAVKSWLVQRAVT